MATNNRNTSNSGVADYLTSKIISSMIAILPTLVPNNNDTKITGIVRSMASSLLLPEEISKQFKDHAVSTELVSELSFIIAKFAIKADSIDPRTSEYINLKANLAQQLQVVTTKYFKGNSKINDDLVEGLMKAKDKVVQELEDKMRGQATGANSTPNFTLSGNPQGSDRSHDINPS